MDFPGGSDGKASVYNAGDLGLIPGSGRSPGVGNGSPLQCCWPGESPWTEEPGGLQFTGSQLDTTEHERGSLLSSVH